jgi:hypothetical protein
VNSLLLQLRVADPVWIIIELKPPLEAIRSRLIELENTAGHVRSSFTEINRWASVTDVGTLGELWLPAPGQKSSTSST